MVRRASIVFGLSALVAVALASASSGQSPGPGAGPPGGSPPGLDKAIAAKEKHAERLLDTPGIAGIGVGLNSAGKPVIRIYKEKPDVAGVPDALEGVPTQSVTTGILQARAPTDRFPRPVPIGVSSGNELATGTLGARVTDGTNVYALSNNHVFAGINSSSIGDPILQPGPIEDGGVLPDDQIGTLHDYETIDFAGNPNTMDAAIALTSTGMVGTATPPDGYGTPSPVTAPASIGQAVQKYGRTTGHQLGTVAEISLTVDVCYLLLFNFCLQEAQFVNQISISPGTFSAPGDSGSLIVTQGGNQPVALLFAGGDGLTIGSPIDVVLQRFGVTIDGSTPPDGPPGAPTSLSASPGDTSASLSWNAPSFDGNSPITGYRVYRGTSPNPTTALTPDLGVVTSYVDTGLTNGTPYYYKVSALNANGEGPLSNQAQVTPIAFVPPSEPLPTLDDFNRGFENPLSDQGRWSNGVNGGEMGLYVPSVWLACSIATTCTAWRNTTPQYGPDSEVWARLSVLPGDSNQLRLYARLQQPGTAGFDGYMLRTTQLSGTDQVSLERVDNGTIVTLLTINQELVAGDLLLLRVQGQVLEAWRNNGVSWSRMGVVADATYSGPGYTGIGLRGTTGRADDFGARTMGAPPPPDTQPPSAPGTLTASALSSTQIDLAWGAALDNVGVVSYRIERCQGAGCSNFSQIATTTALSYSNGGLSASTPYTYRVRAEDAAGNLGSYSNEASATTFAIVPPSEPLPTLDNFDDGFENPLSDQGRWSNGVNGGAETGLYVPSIWLACSKSTTCTSWRNDNDRQYGPDTEVWARLSVLPGDSNQLRLYARLRQPGSTSYDGYMLRTNQLPGTDQVWIERVDNDTFVTLLTINQELAAGDILLLRVQGQTLEAWLYRGSWSRLGVVQDATYGAAGYVGVGLRGTTGRADDFGARTMGASPPPDTTPPSAPGTLTASALSSTQIDLAWGAALDNVGVVSYRIERCEGVGCSTFSEIATSTALSYSNGGLTPSTSYSYRVRAEDAVPLLGPYSNVASASTQASPRPLYFSLEANGTVGGLAVANEDVVSFDGVATFSLAFDGSDIGLSSRRLDAFGWLDADSLLFSLDTDGAALPGVTGTVDDSDIIRFDAISLGPTTAGTFSMYFDGSDVGLTTNAEDVDAFELLSGGTLLLSTEGASSVTGASGADEDLLAFTPATLGSTTSGTFALYFDGSDVGLSASGEDLDAAAVDAAGRIYLSTRGDLAVTGASGADEDVFVFNPSSLGTNTAGTFGSSPYFDGSAFGLAGNDVFAIDLPPGA